MKKNRHVKIYELISKHEIETQDELLDYLRAEGFDVTQATVSRDIRELDIVKITTDRGTYKYTSSHSPQVQGKKSVSLANTLTDAVQSVNFAQNIIVVKTTPGMSSPVAVAIDNLAEPRILGCVAGDDTIIVVVTDNEAAYDITSKMKLMLSGK
ncbi:MAG: arginine repressor [Clostridia bacterium]|nr:arginine repressor [Clostridia bacterium]